ncbi:MAG: hypothetical protein AB8G96_08575 [Phycisphaerales bacterium]
MPPAIAGLLDQILWPVLLPGTIAGVLLLLAWRPWVRGEGAETGHGAAWVLPITAGIGFIIAFFDQAERITWPFPDKWHGLAYAAGMLVGVGAVVATIRSSWLSLLVAAAGAGAVAFYGVDLPTLGDTKGRLLLAGAAVLAVLSTESLATRRPGPVVPALFWLGFTGLSITVLSGGFARLSLMAAGLSAVAGGAVVCGVLHPRFRASRGGAAVLATMFALLLPTAWIYGNQDILGPTPYVLLAAIPIAGWLGELPIFGRIEVPRGERASDEPAGVSAGPPLVRARRRLSADLARLLIPALLAVAAIAVARGGSTDTAEDAADDPSSFYGG